MAVVLIDAEHHAACAGGFKYKPMMSAALVSESGSVSRPCSARSYAGLSPCLRQTRATIMLADVQVSTELACAPVRLATTGARGASPPGSAPRVPA